MNFSDGFTGLNMVTRFGSLFNVAVTWLYIYILYTILDSVLFLYISYNWK